MKKLVLGLAVLGGIVFASAQESNQSPSSKKQCCSHKEGKKCSKGENKLDKMKQDLNLSDEQVNKIKALHAKEEGEREKERAGDMAKAEARREKNQKQMKSILTPEQYKKWQENMKQKPEHGKNKKH